jgi:hypothetical protein
MIVYHLRKEQVAGRKCHREPYEIERGCHLETARHIYQTSENIHGIIYLLYY